MHDVSVAQAIAEAILGKVGESRVKELDVRVSLGKLRFHDTKQVEFWIKNILRKSLGSELKVRVNFDTIEPEIRCSCGYSGKVEPSEEAGELAHHGILEMKCPSCGSGEYEIISGRECLVHDVQIKI